VALSYGYNFTKIEEMRSHICVPQNMQESTLALQTTPSGNVFVDLVLLHKKLLPSILHAPELELKPFSDNLKYVFIGDNNTLHIIIVNCCAITKQPLDGLYLILRALAPRCVCITYYWRTM